MNAKCHSAEPNANTPDNRMLVWDHAHKTDPNATKESTAGGHKHTSISGYWMFQKATELWGPVGSGWGYDILEDRIDIGGPIMRQVGEQEEKIADTQIHTMKISLWYLEGDEKKAIVQYGHTPFVYRSKWGAITDMEAPKKSLTDAIKKALSMLGFCSDVYMGQFDDRNYVDAVRTEFAIEKADDEDAEFDAKRNEFTEWAKKEIDAYKLIPNKPALKAVLAAHRKKVIRQAPVVSMNPDSVMQRFQAAHDAAVEALTQKETTHDS